MKSLILAGGSGTRLWPLSRELYPKQFLKFSGTSLFQDTLRRCLKVSDISEIFVVTSEKQKFFVYGQIEELKLEVIKDNILLEKEQKNTLPAICLGLSKIESKYGKTNVGIFSSDHIMGDDAMDTISGAEKVAQQHLIAFGIIPTTPDPNYGYIKPGCEKNGVYEILEFKEKPDINTAKRYVKNGYLWNAGIFLFDIELFKLELCIHAPEMWTKFFTHTHVDIPSLSVDYGLMEKSRRVAVVKLDSKWSDLGTFDAIYEELNKNKADNAIHNCDDVSINSNRNLIFSTKNKAVSLIDVNDTVVVDTEDALLVCPRGSSHKVKEVVSRLKAQGDERADIHQTVYRPWGTYTVFETAEMHKIKNIKVLPGKKLSLQLHNHRSEHWVLVKGKALVEIDGVSKEISEGESTYISDNTKHRLHNLGNEILEIIEVQFGKRVDEDDIVRFDDEYGRA